MQNRLLLVNFLQKKRQKTKNKLTWKIVFFSEQWLSGAKNRKFVINLLNRKLSTYVNQSIPPNYTPKGIIHSAKEWMEVAPLKEMEGNCVKTIFPSHTLFLNAPNSFSNKVHPAFQYINQFHQFPESNLYFFKNARVVKEAGSVISYDDRVFADFTMEYGKEIEDCKVFNEFIQKATYLEGTFATIASCSTDYFHWIFDIFPRLKLLEDVIDKIDFLIVPKSINEMQIEMLNSIGIAEDKLLKIDNRTHFICENLFVPTLPVRKLMMPKWACDFLRETFTPHNVFEKHRKVYISREDAVYRKILNEKEITNYLQNIGFEIIQMASLPFKEQVRVCSEAKIIVSPHGAGLSNTVFCQGAKIFELFPTSYVNTCFWFLSNQANNEYYYMLGEAVDDAASPVWQDFKIDIELFKTNLNKIMNK
ncbi:MAG: hypothetical protein PWQ75_1036 [Methanolobus sp.]|uniref:glycosyltransferase family 61 protein n=1 Tax=Methanolobus sp. TaxID=1874737 RepID=UPI002590CDA6|nr:glycosyltransferase family 61 protein [Methanolobus sp.]MDK2831284.1 hypothetical protein [Methanolobus sp.]